VLIGLRKILELNDVLVYDLCCSFSVDITMNYHAHIYWRNPEERERAIALRPELAALGCDLGQIHDRPIGPHPLPMYQVMYNSSLQHPVESVLGLLSLSVLLHEDIGIDHVRDHTDGARWINDPLDLDLDFLEDFD
jgi:DOPA 4,5-dioxygenase